MTDERRLLSTGMPLEDIISNCHAMRQDRTLSEFSAQQETVRVCKCGGSRNCPDCPNKKQ